MEATKPNETDTTHNIIQTENRSGLCNYQASAADHMWQPTSHRAYVTTSTQITRWASVTHHSTGNKLPHHISSKLNKQYVEVHEQRTLLQALAYYWPDYTAETRHDTVHSLTHRLATLTTVQCITDQLVLSLPYNVHHQSTTCCHQLHSCTYRHNSSDLILILSYRANLLDCSITLTESF